LAPEVSIVIPARNEEAYIEMAMESVAAQTWPREQLEIVVVDNGSTDTTVEVVRRFSAKQPHLPTSVVHEPVPGVSRAKNRGAAAACGKWIIFLDADSRLAPDLVAEVMRWTQQGFAAGSISVVADSRDTVDRAFFGLMELGKRLFSLQAQMFYCARDLFLERGGFAEDLKLAEDREFLLRIRRQHVPMCQVTGSWIATSPRRLRRLPFRINMVYMFIRWTLANWGIGRRWRY